MTWRVVFMVLWSQGDNLIVFMALFGLYCGVRKMSLARGYMIRNSLVSRPTN